MGDSVNADHVAKEHVVEDARPQPERPPLVTVFTRLARFSPQTRRWHNVPPPKPQTGKD